MPYSDLLTIIDAANPAGRNYYERGSLVRELTDEVIDHIVASAEGLTSPYSVILIQHIHGAASRVALTATAFPARGEYFLPLNIAAWDGERGARHIAWARNAWAALQPFAVQEAYVNFMNDEGPDRVRTAYGVNYERLVALKDKYDPANFFRLNQNIRPTVQDDDGW